MQNILILLISFNCVAFPLYGNVTIDNNELYIISNHTNHKENIEWVIWWAIVWTCIGCIFIILTVIYCCIKYMSCDCILKINRKNNEYISIDEF